MLVATAEGDDLVKQLLSLLCDPVQSELTSSDLDLLSNCKAATTGLIAQYHTECDTLAYS